MSKPKKDPSREERIRNEAVVDAYGPEEQAMGWYYYLENKLRFPFQAKCIASKVVSPLRKGEIVEVRRKNAVPRIRAFHSKRPTNAPVQDPASQVSGGCVLDLHLVHICDLSAAPS